MKIGVIGAGLFGVTVAFRLAKYFEVDLFEKNDDILRAASDVHHCRIHMGYHYPRSSSTVKEVLKAQTSFKKEFSDAIMHDTENYYCISKNNSLTKGEEYLKFCRKHDLKFSEEELEIVDKNKIDLCLKVEEELYDYDKLKEICWKKLEENNVNVFLKKQATKESLKEYDYVVICTYSELNELLEVFPKSLMTFQYEVCEKVFVELPKSFGKKSILTLDGPFTSIDPVGTTGLFILGNVIHTVHSSNTGKTPEIDSKFLPLLNKGIIKNPPITNFKKFIESAEEFIPEIRKAKHVGSSFCIKAVLPFEDDTDTRPTLVKKINEKVFTVFSGKMPTCVDAADNILEQIQTSEK